MGHEDLAAVAGEGGEVGPVDVLAQRQLADARLPRAGVLRVEGQRVEGGVARHEEAHPFIPEAGMVGRALGEAGAVHGHRIARLQGVEAEAVDHQLHAFTRPAEVGAPGVEARVVGLAAGQREVEADRAVEHPQRVDLRIRQATLRGVGTARAA